MQYDKTVAEVFQHIAKKHPELLKQIRATDCAFPELDQHLGHKFITYYAKDMQCELARLCDEHGSDKGELSRDGHPYPWPSHSYTDFYARLWAGRRHDVRRVCEVGLGTNNPALPSSMGIRGKPGASLRVWRDYFPHARIFGGDIDRESLFAEERIKTYYVDQLNPQAIREFWKDVGEADFDFILDDGLHTFEAGACLFLNSIDKLSPSGIYVIEDVGGKDLIRFGEFFRAQPFRVEFVTMYRPNLPLGDNSLVVVRRQP